MNTEYQQEHINKINMGQLAKNFLESDYWEVLLKPILDSMIKGLVDIRDVKKVLLSSDRKASVEVLSRGHAAEYIEKIEEYINAYVDDGNASQAFLDKMAKTNDLYKEL